MKISTETTNVLRLSISIVILFSAVLAHEFIMEPLIAALATAGRGGIEHRDGYLALCLIYFFNTISCFFAPYVVSKLSGKWAMVAGMMTIIIVHSSYFLPNRYFILIASSIGGFGATFIWVGQGQYIIENVSDENREKNTSIQWALYKMSLIIGGIFFFFYFQNEPIEAIAKNGQMEKFFMVFLACIVISIINTCFLPQSEMSRNRVSQPFFQTTKNCFKLLKTQRMISLAVFFFYTGLVRSFWISIYPFCIKFTSNLASNTTRILTIGMIVTGCGQVIGSIFVAIIGNKIRKFGQHVLILGALILHVILFLMISLSFPNDAPLHHTDGNGPVFPLSVYLAMAISALLGFGDAILQTQIYSYIAKYYQRDSSSVFSIFRFSSGIASTGIFFAAQYFYLVHHMILLTISALLGGLAILQFHRSVKNMYQQKAPVVVLSISNDVGRKSQQSVSPLPLVGV